MSPEQHLSLPSWMIHRDGLYLLILAFSGSYDCHVPAPVFVTTAFAHANEFVMNFHAMPAGTSIVPLPW